MKKSFKEKILPGTVMATLLLLWELFSRLFRIPEYLLPAPTRILEAFVSDWRILLDHSVVTFLQAVAGFALGTALAVVLSLMMSLSANVKVSVYPLLVATQTVPLVAIAPILAVWFGFGILPKILLAAIVVFFPVVVSTVKGLYSYDQDALRLMKSMKSSRFHIYTKLKIPSALPYFFTGLKTAAAYSVMGAVIGEWVGAQKGLGIYLTRAMSSFRTASMFAIIAIIVAMSILMFKGVELLERKIVFWNREEERKI